MLRFYKRGDMNRDNDGASCAVDYIIGQDSYHCRNYNESNAWFIKRSRDDDNAGNLYQTNNGLNRYPDTYLKKK